MPLAYRVAGVWGGHEGSLLLWLLMLNVWTLAVATFSRHLPAPVIARILAVMGLVSVGFLLFMLLTSNPFDRLLPAAADGRDLNPLLQDPGMVIHPPMLYMGYVGFSVAFAFAIAALDRRQPRRDLGALDAALDHRGLDLPHAGHRAGQLVGLLRTRLGRLVVLGPGGKRLVHALAGRHGADPLAGGHRKTRRVQVLDRAAGDHGLLAVAARAPSSCARACCRRCTPLPPIRARGLFILAFLVVVIGGSLALYAWRAPQVGLGARFELVSRESMLLGNNVMLVVAMGTVLLGTLYPLVLDALGLGKISVGPPYFDSVFVPIMTPLVFLMGVGPLARWRADRTARAWRGACAGPLC